MRHRHWGARANPINFTNGGNGWHRVQDSAGAARLSDSVGQ